MNDVNILIIETENHDAMAEFYEELFGNLGYSVEIDKADGHLPLEGNASPFLKKVYDVVACDISMGSSTSFVGLEVIMNIKTRYPNILVIANSQNRIPTEAISSFIPSFDLFVDKNEISEPRYSKYITEKVANLFARNPYLHIDYQESDLSSKSKLFKLSLEDLLRSATFTSHSEDKTFAIRRVILNSILDGNSKSSVYEMKAYNDSGICCRRSVLKLGGLKETKQEYENYLSFVKWYLPSEIAPVALGYAQGYSVRKKDGLAAINYSYVGAKGGTYVALAEYIKNLDAVFVTKVANYIFGDSERVWYHPSNVKLESKKLAIYYRGRWFSGRKPDSIETKFNKDVDRVGGRVMTNSVTIAGYELRRPRTLFSSTLKGYQTCIRHGDLNARNILVNDTGSVFFIDFNNTKRGHVFEDFVVFEASFRLGFNCDTNFDDLVDDDLNPEQCKDSGYFSTISRVRDLARKSFPEESWDNYLFALACFCLRLTRLSYLDDWQRDQILACLISCQIKLGLTIDNAKAEAAG